MFMQEKKIRYHIRCWAMCVCVAGIMPQLPAQTRILDSIYQLAKNAPNDSIRLEEMRIYGLTLARIDFPKGMKVLQEGGKEAKEKGWLMLAADYDLQKGISYYERGDYINSIASDEQTEKLYRSLPESKQRTWGLAAIFNNLGAAYSLINELEIAQQFYIQSIRQLEKLKDSSALLIAYFNVGFLYIDMQQWEQANKYLQLSLNHAPAQPSYDSYVHTLARKAAISFRRNKIAEGKQLLQKAESLLPKTSFELAQIYCLNARGDYHAAVNEWSQALELHQKAYQLSQQYNDPYYIADEAWEVGRSYLNLQQQDSAAAYLHKALQVARQYNYMPKVKFILKELSGYYGSVGKFEKAWEVSTQLANYTDSLVALQNHNRILLNDARYESTKKEGRINELEAAQLLQQLQIKQKNTLNYILIGAAITMLLIGVLSYRNYRQKQKLQQQRIYELETEKQLMAAEAVMKGEDKERSRIAKDLHDGLGGMLSGIKHSFQHMKENLIMTPDNQLAFERSMDMLDSSIKELRRVAHNMMPETLVKFGLDVALNDFCNSVSQSGAVQLKYESFGLDNISLDQQTAIAMYRMVQELVNNILKHAAASKAIVQIAKTEDGLTITVEDDGKGFDPQTLQNTTGMGWSNLQSRIDYLKGKLHVQSAPGKGTSVVIEITT
jgi:signal transduction histidine kinase